MTPSQDNEPLKAASDTPTTLRDIIIDAATNTVSANVPCQHCGYNLRSLNIESVCPECGQPVISSIPANKTILLADPAWRKHVVWGINRIIFAAIGTPLTILLGIILFEAAASSGMLQAIGTLVLQIGLLFVFAAGILEASTRDANAPDDSGPAWPHILTKITAVLTCLLPTLSFALMITGRPFPFSSKHDSPITLGLTLTILCGTISVLSLCLCLRSIARRARDKYLESNTNTWMVFFSTTMGFIVLLGLVAWLADLRDSMSGREIFMCIAILPALALLILHIPAVSGLFSYRSLLQAGNAYEEPTKQP